MTNFNEHALEMAVMELFENEGYIYTNGEDIHKELSGRHVIDHKVKQEKMTQ